ncbi:DUF4358 domain-containing protein [Porcipelethomonas sp.]|uniref:DUF4358 domain-containing protein n=1 Tax=Porcipelethomonas sp. TaxID=2981675 RepID=UPI003EF73635
MNKMKKRIAAGLLTVCVILSATGCEGNSKKAEASKPLKEITGAVMDCGVEFPEMVEVSEDNFQFRYAVSTDDYSEYSVWWAGSGGDADEICLIKAKDTDKVRKAVEERKKSQEGVFKDYVEEQYEKLCDSEVKTKGDYVYWLCTNDNKKAEDTLLSYFE